MANNRKETENYIIKLINELLPDKSNEPIYREFFSKLSDTAFKKFMDDLESGEKFLVVICPNLGKQQLSVDRNLEIAKKLGIEFFQRIWFPENGDSPSYLSPIPYMVMDLPIRRQSQMLDKKISIPEDTHTVDTFTGQPAGKSAGAKINYTELQVLSAMGLDDSISELIKMRGGDEGGYRALYMSLKQTGHVNLDVVKQYATGVESTRTLKTFLTGAHLQNTL